MNLFFSVLSDDWPIRVRAYKINGEIWYHALDVGVTFEVHNVLKVVKAFVAEEDRRNFKVKRVDKFGKIEYLLLNKTGVYSLLLGMRSTKIINFKRYLIEEVLPKVSVEDFEKWNKEHPITTEWEHERQEAIEKMREDDKKYHIPLGGVMVRGEYTLVHEDDVTE